LWSDSHRSSLSLAAGSIDALDLLLSGCGFASASFHVSLLDSASIAPGNTDTTVAAPQLPLFLGSPHRGRQLPPSLRPLSLDGELHVLARSFHRRGIANDA